MGKINTASAKPISKAERARNTLAKANASAAKKSNDASFEEFLPGYIEKARGNEGAARVMAHIMNNDFAEHMAAYKCHWSAFSPANCRTDNEKAILARINERKKAMRDLAEAKGLVNTYKPWSDMQAIAKRLYLGDTPRDTTPKPLDTVLHKDLLHAYKAGMKEERQTETETELMMAIGNLLTRYFKEDLSKYG